MNFIIFGLFFSFILSIISLEFFKTQKYLKIIGFVLSISLLVFLIPLELWQINFFSCNNWRFFAFIIVLISFLVILNVIEDKTFDVYLLNFLVIIGSIIIIFCDHLLIVYLGIELQTFSLFILISKNRSSIKGSEAGLKYFILGALSSGFYLLGLSLFFLSGVSLNLGEILLLSQELLIVVGSVLIILSLIFKLALFPFHFWIPDIYEGSSWEVISVISTLPKISILIIIIQFGINSDIFLLSCLLSIIIGTLGAFNQTKLKRLLAYSGISHMGFIMLGCNICIMGGYEVGVFYLFIYILTILSIFLLLFNNLWGKDYFIIELSNIYIINKTLALIWVVVFLSIAGIPPFAGFMSKWFILWNAMNYGYLFSSAIGILFSAIGAGYYLRVVKIIYFQKMFSYKTWESILKPKSKGNEFHYFLLGVIIYTIIFLIINPSPLIINIYESFSFFF